MYDFKTIQEKRNEIRFSTGKPVYIKSTNAVGFIIDSGPAKEWQDTCRTDTDGVRSFEELESFKYEHLARPNVFVPHSVARRIVAIEAARGDLHRLYGYDLDRVYPRTVSRRDLIANTERLPCGLLVRHRQNSKLHGFQILEEAKIKSALKSAICRDEKHPPTLGFTNDGKTIVFSGRYYRNNGVVYGKYKTLSKDDTAFYLGGYNYNPSYLKELGYTEDHYKHIRNKIENFAKNYEKN